MKNDERQGERRQHLADDVAVQDAQHRVPSQLTSVPAGESRGFADVHLGH